MGFLKRKNKNEISVGKNTFYNIIKTCSTIAFSLVTFPYITRVLGPENVGKVNFGSSIVAYISLIATLGVTAYAVRECSKVKDDKREFEKTASQIFSINICTAIIAYIILAICLACVPKLADYRVLILVQSASVILGVLGTDWINTAMEDFRYIALRTLVFQFIAIVFMLIAVRSPEQYIGYAIISLISTSAANVVNIFYIRRYCKIRFTLRMDWKKHFPPIITLFIMIVSQQIFLNLDVSMLGFMKDDTQVGIYSAAVKVVNMVTQVTGSLVWVLMPQLSAAFVKKDYEKINGLLRYAMQFTVVLGLPICVGMNLCAEEIIYTVSGSEYMEAANCLRILSLSMIFGYVNNIYGNLILLPSSRDKQFVIAYMLSACLNAAANIPLIPLLGIYGASITTVLSSILVTIVTMIKIEKEIKFERKWAVFRGPIVGCVLIVVICIIMRYLVPGMIARLFIEVAVSVVVYFVVLKLMKDEFVQGFKIKRNT